MAVFRVFLFGCTTTCDKLLFSLLLFLFHLFLESDQQTQVEPFGSRTSAGPLEQDSLLEVNVAFSFVGGLCSYTPRKVHIENTFELGVSRVVSPQAPAAQVATNNTNTTNNDQSQDYLKPAEENVPWSSETSSDLLF